MGQLQCPLPRRLPPTRSGEVLHVAGGFCEAFEGETVDFDWEPTARHGGQDGYSFRAISVWPRGRVAPHRTIRYLKAGESPYTTE
jgi:CspA family cold shock protein